MSSDLIFAVFTMCIYLKWCFCFNMFHNIAFNFIQGIRFYFNNGSVWLHCKSNALHRIYVSYFLPPAQREPPIYGCEQTATQSTYIGIKKLGFKKHFKLI